MWTSVLLAVFFGCSQLIVCAEPRNTERDMVISHIFPSIQADMSKYPEIHVEPWLCISSHLDASSIWNMSLTCKAFGAAFRQPAVIPALRQNFPYPELLDMLADSDRTIGEWAKPLLTAENVLNMKMVKANRKFFDEHLGTRYLSKLGTQTIVGLFLPRAQNLHVEKMIYFDVGSRRHIDIDSIPDQLDGNLFVICSEVGNKEMHYLPEHKNGKLFDLINPSTLARLSWSFNGSWKLVINSILADYVLPAWRNEYNLSSHEVNCIQALVKWGPMYTKYFNSLMWALMYIHGAVDYPRDEINMIGAFLRDLGFSWDPMVSSWNENNYIIEWPQRTECMLYIYATAVQWNLDLRKIAEATPANPISQEILGGNIPACVLDMAQLNERNIFTIAQEGEMLAFKKAKFKNGKFEIFGETASLKRKRDEEDSVVPISNKRPNIFRGVPPIIQDSSTLSTLTMSPWELQALFRMHTRPPGRESEEERNEEGNEESQ